MNELEVKYITHELKQKIDTYISLLNSYLSEYNNPRKLDYHELRNWIPNCIECLEFALNNEELLKEKPNLYEDTLNTIGLLYSWIIEEKSWAYIALRQKFRKVCSAEEVGNAFKKLHTKIKEEKENNMVCGENKYVSFIDENGNLKSTVQIFKELSDAWSS